ncbi:hypothetical protein EDEG_02637 [Edhazardia aedis USNM 41457]|uniref:Uncharacterized protein n=1 Tax=Edhazardia aedis (strain USNM 41457) TaxID=1003232 RepID=J8ZTI6_EDHAE|nr:hypothetical protein EDEG_02637 [Edhazardia aedis USNM 41457]|eukprot:EJW02993.1 hypothetical protein EDEG_02637 [Edhazardia aedis USNM 41457]
MKEKEQYHVDAITKFEEKEFEKWEKRMIEKSELHKVNERIRNCHDEIQKILFNSYKDLLYDAEALPFDYLLKDIDRFYHREKEYFPIRKLTSIEFHKIRMADALKKFEDHYIKATPERQEALSGVTSMIITIQEYFGVYLCINLDMKKNCIQYYDYFMKQFNIIQDDK